MGATGIDETKGVASRNYSTRKGNDGDYGTFIADNLVGVNHDHFFCSKLDLEVDGTNNSFETVQLKKIRMGGTSVRRSLWVAQTKIAKVESDAELNENMHEPALWRVINPNVLNPMGYPVSYELIRVMPLPTCSIPTTIRAGEQASLTTNSGLLPLRRRRPQRDF
jgi:primary-amine oxidase